MRLLRHAAIAIIAASMLLGGMPAFAQTAPSSPILDAVARAKTMLAPVLQARIASRAQPYRLKGGYGPIDVTLAVWNRDTDAITLVSGWKSHGILTVTTPGAPAITVAYNNGVATQYAMPHGSRSIVVGVITPTIATVRLTKRRVAYDARDVMYVPYDEQFFTPDVLTAGSDYLSYLIRDALDDLRNEGVRSRAFPDKLLADVADPYLLKSIVVIEHADYHPLLSDLSPEHVVGAFLVKLAVNRDDAFDSSVSTAGARGLVQFIPSTYALIVRAWPSLGLIPDFAAGMGDHRNAIKAQVALLDSNLAGMPPAIRAIALDPDKSKIAAFLAAAYNGGSTRVRRAYATWGDGWAAARADHLASAQSTASSLASRIASLRRQATSVGAAQLAKIRAAIASARSDRAAAIAQIASIRRSSLRQETVLYVAKLRRVYAMFSAGLFATPNAPSGALPGNQPVLTPSSPGAIGPICFPDGGCSQ